ncbi:MAG: DUF2283 domain-containing protein [Chloroflexi bacterium]|nr:DUF2283 domain-containing protein [Chloroflexota bacterium]
MKYPHLRFDPEADCLYVRFAPGEVAETVFVGELRMIDYSKNREVVLGLEFVSASGGVDLREMPFAATVAALIGDSGLSIPIYA